MQVIRLVSRGRVPGARAFLEQRRLWRRLVALDRSDPIDVVEGPEPALWAAPRRLPFPAIVRIHGGHRFFALAEGRAPAPARSWFERRSIDRADDLVAVSAYVGHRTADLLDLGDRSVTVIPNAVDVEEFRPASRPGERGAVLFVGTVCEKKGVRQLVEGFPTVLAAVPDAHLRVVGRDQVDPVTGESVTERLRSSLPAEIAGRVEFVGPVAHDQVAAQIAASEVCALPSHMEAQGLAWVEVMASGRALVASTAGPGPEVVEDGVSGLLVDPHDPQAIAAAVIALLDDPGCRERLAAGARSRAVEQFSIDEVVVANIEHHRSVVERWRTSRG